MSGSRRITPHIPLEADTINLGEFSRDRLIKIMDSFKVGDSTVELGEERRKVRGFVSYHYHGRRNGGPWIDLAQYGNRWPEDWNVPDRRPGYHLADITPGVFGEASKVVEEAAEFADAVEQQCKVMALVELSDMMGAVQGYLDNYHAGTTIDDLCMMASITARAFNNGHRESRQ